jgi:hypothetical protein
LLENYVPPALFVTWQDPKARTIYPVGRLLRLAGSDPGYEFAYLTAALDAQKNGFAAFLAFPDLAQVYRSRELPPFFQNRLMTSGRPEFAAQLAEIGLEANAGPEQILARTNGLRATDPYEVFAEFEPGQVTGEWETLFFARSLHYLGYPEALDALSTRQQLFCMRDVQNTADPKAVALRTEGNALVGYCPAYLVGELDHVLAEPAAVLVTVERLNPAPAPLQHRLQCHLRLRPRGDFHSYRYGRYEPLSTDALRLSPWVQRAKVA